MSRRGRRRRAALPPPTGPIDPWTGLPGERQSAYTPMGQVEQYGLLADGLRRDPSTRRGYRRGIASIGLWLVLLAALVGIVGFVSSFLASHG